MVCFTRLCEVSHDDCAFRILRLHPLGGFAKTDRASFRICPCHKHVRSFLNVLPSEFLSQANHVQLRDANSVVRCYLFPAGNMNIESVTCVLTFSTLFDPFRPLVLESGSEAVAGFSRIA